MKNIGTFLAAAVFCGGGALLAGCHQQEPAGSVSAPSADPSAQAQMRDVDSNPHIPDAQKAAIKASIAAHAPGGGGANPKPGP